MFDAMSVLLVCEVATDCNEIEKGLRSLGVAEIKKIEAEANFLKMVSDFEADMILLDIKQPSKALLSRLEVLNEYCPKPVVFFSESREHEIIKETVKVGVSAYVVDGKSADRIGPILEVAMLRFRECQLMRKELDSLKDKLSERGVIEKAKGLLMAHKNMSEDQAYKTMRKMAMDQGKKISVIAHEICDVISGLEALQA